MAGKNTPRGIQTDSELGTRPVKENRADFPCDHAACTSIVKKLRRSPAPLHEWRTQVEHAADEHPGWNSTNRARFKDLECESNELRAANDFLQKASGYFAQAELDHLFCR